MIEKEKEVTGKYQFNFSWVMYVPLILLVGVIPLIVQLVKVDIPDEYILYITGNNIDLFTQAKSTLIFCAVGAIFIILFMAFDKAMIRQGVQAKIYYVSAAVYVIFTLASMWLSEYQHVAMWGLPNRAEGGIILVCYIVMMLYAYWVVRERKALKYILIPIGFVAVVSAFLGYFQYIGEDLFMTTDFGKQLIIPEHYAEDRANLSALYEEGNIYGTMGHYNYVGSFSAMVVPLFVTLTIYIKNYKLKIVTALLSICSLFLLFGSTARSGLIGLACSIVVFLVIFAKDLLKQWKILLVVGLVGIGGLIGLNSMTNGEIFARIPGLFRDVVQLFQPVEEGFDYKANLPIQNVTAVEGDIVIEIPGDSIRVTSDGEILSFYNQQEEQIPYIYFNMGDGQSRYFVQEGVYEPFIFYPEEYEGRTYLQFYWKDYYIIDIDITEEALNLAHRFSKEPIVLEEPPRIGFEGKEQIGSARGYIWSRSFPILADTVFIGTGPDTYGFEFPQEDVFGKWHAYGTPNMIVDKAHNLYLQIAINQGVVALIAFLVLVGAYLVQSFKLYTFKATRNTLYTMGSAIMLAIVGYLGAGLFNDSVVTVAPIFWVLLGTGMAVNAIIDNENIRDEKLKMHGTVSMKTRRHID